MNHLLSKNTGITSLFDDMGLRKMELGTQGSILAFLKQKQAHGLLDWVTTGQVKTESIAFTNEVRHELLPLCFSQLDF